MTSQPRPVWIDPGDTERLFKIVRHLEDYGGLLGNTDANLVRSIAYAVRAAPADAAEAVYDAIYRQVAGKTTFGQVSDATTDALEALGYPHPDPAPPTENT